MPARNLKVDVAFGITDHTKAYSADEIAKVSLSTGSMETLEQVKRELHRLVDVAVEAMDTSIRAKAKQEEAAAEAVAAAEAAANK